MRATRPRTPLALLAAIAAALALAACGSADRLPSDAASRLDSALGNVGDRTASGDCAGATAALEQAQRAFGDLPASVDTALRQRIADGLSKLTRTVPTQCREAAAGPADTTPADTTPAAPADTTPADTTPADTTPTTPADTTPTTPADTTPTTPADTTPVPPADTTPVTPPGQGGTPPGQGGTPPGQSPSGGVSPDPAGAVTP